MQSTHHLHTISMTASKGNGSIPTRPRGPVKARASAREELKRLLHKGLVILEDASVSGLLVEDEFGIRQAVRQVDRVAGGHHLVLIAIHNQNRRPDGAKILLRLRAQALIALSCLRNVAIVIGLSRSVLRSCSRFRNALAARRPFAVEVKKR